jgi:hypothetical protein
VLAPRKQPEVAVMSARNRRLLIVLIARMLAIAALVAWLAISSTGRHP